MNGLVIKGRQEFMGKEIPIVEGGFGENSKVVLAKTVADIHEREVKFINQCITRMIDKNRLKESIDYIDLKQVTDSNLFLENDIFTKAQWGNAKNVFMLSERGYTKLIKYMDDDKSWEIMEEFVDNYFAMRQIVNSDEQLKANLLLSIYNGGQEGVLASKQLTEIEVKEATAPLITKIEMDKPLVDFATTISACSDSIDIGTFAKVVKDEGISMGRNKLFEWFRYNGYLMKNNVPYQKYIDNKYFEIIEYTYHTPYGEKLGTKTLVTGLGQIRIVEKLRKEFGEK